MVVVAEDIALRILDHQRGIAVTFKEDAEVVGCFAQVEDEIGKGVNKAIAHHVWRANVEGRYRARYRNGVGQFLFTVPFDNAIGGERRRIRHQFAGVDFLGFHQIFWDGLPVDQVLQGKSSNVV